MRKCLERGAVTLTVRDELGGPAPDVRVNTALAKRYHQALVELARALGLPGEVSLGLLAEMRDRGATAVTMEVSSHALDQGRTDGCEPSRPACRRRLGRGRVRLAGTVERSGRFARDGVRTYAYRLTEAGEEALRGTT